MDSTVQSDCCTVDKGTEWFPQHPHVSLLCTTRGPKKDYHEGGRKHSPSTTTQEQTSACHIWRRADAPDGIRLGQRLARRVQDSLHHLAGERPAGERVDGDAARAQGDSEGTGELVEAGFAGAVGVVLECRDTDTIDAC